MIDVDKMSMRVEDLPALYTMYRSRYQERDERYSLMDAVVRGDMNALDNDEELVENRSPNLIQVALEDTSEAASSLPTIRVVPEKPTATGKTKASRMERIGWGYFDHSQMELLVTETVMDMAAFGLSTWVVWPDFEERLPIIEGRDPRTAYPEPGFRPGQRVNRCMFAREMRFTQLPREYQQQIGSSLTEQGLSARADKEVVLVEWFTPEEYVLAALFDTQPSMAGQANAIYPVLLDWIPNKTGICQVIVGSRISLDKEFRGQYDQVIGVLKAHVRLMGIVLDYADQAVYSDIWVKDVIGEVPWGGGAYIELGPNGAIGRVPPAVTSLNVQQDLDRLVDAIHVGGRWPKSRPGEIDQAIASAKFVEATAGMMNTAIKTYHQLLKRMMEQALRLCFLTDIKYFPGAKTISGVLRNQEFVEEYEPAKDINTKNRVRVEYGLGLGRDPAQSIVMMLQLAADGNEYISHDFVMENLEGLTDVEREKVRMDVQKMRQMMLAELLTGLQTKTLPPAALVDIIDAREKGEDLSAIYRKYVVEPALKAAEQQVTPGLPELGTTTPEGQLGGGVPPIAPPGPPDANSLLSRLSAPAGPGSFLGSEVKRGG